MPPGQVAIDVAVTKSDGSGDPQNGGAEFFRRRSLSQDGSATVAGGPRVVNSDGAVGFAGARGRMSLSDDRAGGIIAQRRASVAQHDRRASQHGTFFLGVWTHATEGPRRVHAPARLTTHFWRTHRFEGPE